MQQEFYTGHLFEMYRYFGAHREKDGFIFRVFAPGARGVTVLGNSAIGKSFRYIRMEEAVSTSPGRYWQNTDRCTNIVFIRATAGGWSIVIPMAFAWNYVRETARY